MDDRLLLLGALHGQPLLLIGNIVSLISLNCLVLGVNLVYLIDLLLDLLEQFLQILELEGLVLLEDGPCLLVASVLGLGIIELEVGGHVVVGNLAAHV